MTANHRWPLRTSTESWRSQDILHCPTSIARGYEACAKAQRGRTFDVNDLAKLGQMSLSALDLRQRLQISVGIFDVVWVQWGMAADSLSYH
jgi:hypothetical protein